MDVLSSVLRELRFESASYRRLDLRAPWRLRFDGGLRGVHIVVQGRCSITVDGEQPRNLETGDLVVLPRADSHQMSSVGDEHGPAESALNLAKRTSGPQLNVGGAGPTTTILCGAFFFGDDGHPAVAGLQSFIHVPGQRGRSPSWLTGLTGALAAETVDGGPGSEVVMARLSDALITRALRHHVETGEERGWLRGLSDPYVATALTAVHDNLAARWTLQSLAEAAGLSRAAFAARFADTMHQTPLQYVTQCRMRRAMTLLRSEQLPLAAVATRVGYSSEAALSAAFVRHVGLPPGHYRRSSQQPGQVHQAIASTQVV